MAYLSLQHAFLFPLFLEQIMAAAEENKNFNLMELALLTADKDRCIEWCKQHNLLTRSMKCPKQQCDNDLSWTRCSRVPDGYMWRCSKKSCNGEVSIRQFMVLWQSPFHFKNIGPNLRLGPQFHDVAGNARNLLARQNNFVRNGGRLV